jgi:nucleoside-diphosphate-sugar epimerase
MLVTGGTGTLGPPLVDLLTRAGRPVRVLSRRPRAATGGAPVEWVVGNLATGAGVARAVGGAGVIVHCATSPWARRVDVGGTGRLLEAARLAGSPHLVYISIVGVDRVPFRYYRAKLAAGTARCSTSPCPAPPHAASAPAGICAPSIPTASGPGRRSSPPATRKVDSPCPHPACPARSCGPCPRRWR